MVRLCVFIYHPKFIIPFLVEKEFYGKLHVLIILDIKSLVTLTPFDL